MPCAGIESSIGRVMHNRLKLQGRKAARKWLAKHILHRAVLVLQANLCFFGIGVVRMNGVGMRVQIQQKGIRYHRPAEKQEQE